MQIPDSCHANKAFIVNIVWLAQRGEQ